MPQLMKIEKLHYILSFRGKKIKTSTLSTKTFSFQLLRLGTEVHTRHVHYPRVSVPKEWMKEGFLGMNLWVLEQCYDNTLFTVDYTIREVLHGVCRLNDEVIHKFDWKGIDGWSPLLKQLLTSVILRGQANSRQFQCLWEPSLSFVKK